jgi:general stress protein YciG
MKKKVPAAVELGRRGGKARAINLSKQELSRIGQKGAAARWKKVRKP